MKKIIKYFTIIALACVMVILSNNKQAFAIKALSGYKNPKDIIIAYPADGFTTTSTNVSILGASDFRFDLLLDGEKLETTEHGFFTKYVDLEMGENIFTFENHGKTKELTIIREEKTSSVKEPEYVDYDYDAYGIAITDYLMPRMKTINSDCTKMPIAIGTRVRILGEQGDFYKIVDGSFVSKSGIDLKKRTLKDNKVKKIVVSDNKKDNYIQTTLTMKVNAMHKVEVKDKQVILTLYDTISASSVKIKENDTVSSVNVKVNENNKQTKIIFNLKNDAYVSGYDVKFEDNKMIFVINKGPHLVKKGSLEGAVIYVDAGHGEHDNGTTGPMGGITPAEKDINLRLSIFLKEFLEEKGATVVMTREDDTFYSLSHRVNAIRDLKPDLSISIHCNAMAEISDYSEYYGFSTYYSYDIARPVSSFVNDRVINKMGFIYTNPIAKSLSLTRITACPALLLETCFLSYPDDYEFMIQVKNQRKVARAIGESVEEYIESIAVYSK